jgi:Luciferase-like monooxygenase/Phage integrase, N-terminal SAM-like domain
LIEALSIWQNVMTYFEQLEKHLLDEILVFANLVQIPAVILTGGVAWLVCRPIRRWAPAIVEPTTVANPTGTYIVPALIADLGDQASWRYVEFFTANIRNPHTRRAYARACGQFFAWCEQRGLTLAAIRPHDVATYIEQLQTQASAPSVKQQLAAVRMVFDWLVVGQVVPANPASAVRGPKHVVKTGKTPVLEGEEWRKLLDSIPAATALLGTEESFPQEVVELMGYFQPAEPDQAVQAVPGAGLEVPIWILGSSLYGAQVAAYLGLPFAFASHFAPAMMIPAIAIYRERFRPSEQLAAPNVMLGVTVIAAESDDEAGFLFSSLQQSTLNNRIGRPSRVPPPVENFKARLDAYARAILDEAYACAIVGGPDTVRCGLNDFVRRTGADELMVTANIFDHAKRKRSFEIVAEIHGGMIKGIAARL